MIEQKIRKELENAKITVADIDLNLNSAEITADQIIELSKKRSQLSEIVILYNQLIEIEKSIEENQELLNDKEFKALAEEELETLKLDLIIIEDKIKFEVRPKDPLDCKNGTPAPSPHPKRIAFLFFRSMSLVKTPYL